MPKAKQHKRRRINKIKPLIKTSVHRIKVRHLIVIVLLLGGLMTVSDHSYQVQANSCPDVKIIFARGSGGERYTSSHYLAFKSSLESKLTTTDLTYEFEDLDYPAVSIDVGDGHLGTLLGAYIGSGEAYEFGESVHQGTAELLRTVNNDGCSNTKYVFGGYSQGAVVLLNGITQIDPSKVVYIATFGDPKYTCPKVLVQFQRPVAEEVYQIIAFMYRIAGLTKVF
ncbi:cutinase family protein [Candidatus Saccharibacteria bacterium]|nr:cutinase family protein [Candidatus Saccharibacteria bacterium]